MGVDGMNPRAVVIAGGVATGTVLAAYVATRHLAKLGPDTFLAAVPPAPYEAPVVDSGPWSWIGYRMQHPDTDGLWHEAWPLEPPSR